MQEGTSPPTQWYPELKAAVGDVPKIFVGNKVDQRAEYAQVNKDPKTAPIKAETARKFVEDNYADSKYMECSALTQEGLKGVFDEAMRVVLQKRFKPMTRKNNAEGEGGCNLI